MTACLADTLDHNGGGFIGQEFVELLQSYGVDPKPTTDNNPQSNGLHERMHLVLWEMLRSQKYLYRKNQDQEEK